MKKILTTSVFILLLLITAQAQLKQQPEPKPEPKVIYKTVTAPAPAPIVVNSTIVDPKKVGIYFVNSVSVLEKMPEFSAMQSAIESAKNIYTKKLEGMYQDYENKTKEFQNMSNDKSTPDVILDMKIKEIKDLENNITEFQQKVDDDLQKMQSDKLKPINEKYQNAVKLILKELGGIAVFDISSGALSSYDEDLDVTSKVLKKLGI